MANIEISCRNFTGSYARLNGTRNKNVSRRAFFRAVLTVGMQRFEDLFRLGWRGFVHRFGMGLSAFSFLEQNGNDLCLSTEYSKLDMSEKGAATYWYGMAMAKLVAETELSIPWLAHVDQLRDSGALTTSSLSKERGDLVGKDGNNRWHVIEAKGRSNQYPVSLVTKAKNQAARVIAVNGQAPVTTSACIASLYSQPISVLLDDPHIDNESKEQWRIKDDEFFREYYRGIIEYLREIRPRREHVIGNTVFVAAPLYPFYWEFFHEPPPFPWKHRETDLEIGLLNDIYKKPESALDAIKTLPQSVDEGKIRDDDKVGKDGIAIFGRMSDWEVA